MKHLSVVSVRTCEDWPSAASLPPMWCVFMRCFGVRADGPCGPMKSDQDQASTSKNPFNLCRCPYQSTKRCVFHHGWVNHVLEASLESVLKKVKSWQPKGLLPCHGVYQASGRTRTAGPTEGSCPNAAILEECIGV